MNPNAITTASSGAEAKVEYHKSTYFESQKAQLQKERSEIVDKQKQADHEVYMLKIKLASVDKQLAAVQSQIEGK